MSYILDALKKSEQERELGQVPTINTVHHAYPIKAKTAWPWIAGGALLINAVLGGVVYWYINDESRDHVNKEASVATHGQAGITPGSQAPTVNEPQADSAANPTDPSATLTWPDGEEDAALQSDDSFNDPMLDNTGNAPVPENLPLAEAVNPSVAQPEPSEPEQATQQDSSAIPLLSDMDQPFRASTPPLSIDVHVFSKNIAERFVFVNMVKYREGQMINGQVLLREITPEGVVVNFKGQDFRLARP